MEQNFKIACYEKMQEARERENASEDRWVDINLNVMADIFLCLIDGTPVQLNDNGTWLSEHDLLKLTLTDFKKLMQKDGVRLWML